MPGFDVTERPVFDLGPMLSQTINPTAISSALAIGTAKTTASMAATAIAAGGGVGTAATLASVTASAIAGSASIGTASTTASVEATGVASDEQVGTVETTAFVEPNGIGSSEAFGATVMSQVGDQNIDPTGIASMEAFGDLTIALTGYADGVPSQESVGTVQVDFAVNPDGIDADNTDFGTAQADTQHLPDGIDGTLAFGDPSVTVSVNPDGVPGTAVVGDHKVRVYVNPDGIDADAEAFGTAKTNASMHPDGVASTEVFGDVLSVVTILVVPGPVDPSNDFGDAVVTKKGWVFRPPVNTYQTRLFKEYEGVSLLKENGLWSEVAHPDLERTLAADMYLAGGRDHVVSTGLKAELEGLGYTVTEEVVTTEEYL